MPRKQPHSDFLDRLPPQDLDAERAVLGSILLDPVVLAPVRELLAKPQAFCADAHRTLYSRLMAMHKDEQPVGDLVAVRAALKGAGEYEAIGGGAYLAEITQSVPCAANAAYYAGIVRTHAAKRVCLTIAVELLSGAYDETVSPQDWIDRARGLVQPLVARLKEGGS